MSDFGTPQWMKERIQYLEKENKRLVEALQSIKNELGVPQPGYPAPVANAYEIADNATLRTDLERKYFEQK